MKTAYFVTGTDTGVGKTRASCALLHAMRKHYAVCIGMKPVAAGAERTSQGWVNDDVEALRAASSHTVPARLDNPTTFQLAVSPHIAAQRAGERVDIAHLVRSFKELQLRADAVVVEGAGGFCVPLSHTETGADLATALDLPVILVVGLRLGCLNHALLTAQAIAASGLTLAGWVANRIDPLMPEQDANIESLQAWLNAPLLADWPWQPGANPATLPIELPPGTASN